MAKTAPDATSRSIQAGVLSWLLPGLGHYLLGHRGLGIVCFVAITFPYCTGLAFGGVKDFVNPYTNKWLFLAEIGVGGYTLGGFLVSQSIESYLRNNPDVNEVDFTAPYPESDVAQIYLAAAGLLNILVILDAVSRAQTGQPTFHRELQASAQSERGP